MQKPKILIVDNELYHLENIIDIIEEAGDKYWVLTAFNAKEAFEIAEKEIPDLIITDWKMPEMDGIELIKKLKYNSETSNIPIIMCTGAMLTSENLKTALKAGAIDYIRKPIDPIELIARTQSILKITEYQNKITNYQKEIIEQKNRELAENSLYMVQNNEFHIKLIQELQLFKNNIDENAKNLKDFNQIIDLIELEVKGESWNRFEIYFERVHTNFRKNILKQFPNLTDNDLRLCAFLRLGMSSKDIAAAIFISPDSVKVKRSRLRKKLNLNENDELAVFLSKF